MKVYSLLAIAVLCPTYTRTAQVESHQHDIVFDISGRKIHKSHYKNKKLVVEWGMDYSPNWEQMRMHIRTRVHNGEHPDSIYYETCSFPLFDAIVHHDIEFATFLLNYGANPNRMYSHVDPILFYADNEELFHTLVDHKADALAKNVSANTLLHYCATLTTTKKYKPHDLVLTYCKAGVDPCAVNNDGETAVFSVIRLCHSRAPSSLYNHLALLIHVGVPFDIKPSDGTHNNMSLDQAIEANARNAKDTDENHKKFRTSCAQTIIAAAQKRKQAIREGVGLSLTKDPLSVVFGYDGQTTTELEKLPHLPA